MHDVQHIQLADDGEAYLIGSCCSACGARFLGERSTCAACAARGTMRWYRLGERGRIHSFTTVWRSFPGVETPFVMALVDLDDGVTLRGTLHDVLPGEPCFDLPVRVVFRDSGQRDATGAAWIVHAFVPVREQTS